MTKSPSTRKKNTPRCLVAEQPARGLKNTGNKKPDLPAAGERLARTQRVNGRRETQAGNGLGLIAPQDLLKQLVEKDELLKALTKKLSQKDGTIELLRKQVNDKKSVINELGTQFSELRIKEYIHGKTTETLVAQAAEKDQAVINLTSQVAQQQKSVDFLTCQLNETSQAVASLTTQISEKSHFAAQLTKQLSARELQLSKLANSVQALNAQVLETSVSQNKDIRVRGSSGSYKSLIERIREIASTVLKPEAKVLIVSKGDGELLKLDSREAWHYPQAEDGLHSGYHPVDSSAAISHLEELRARGGSGLLFPNTAFWWLDYYQGLRKHLDTNYQRVWADEHCIIYDLCVSTQRGVTVHLPASELPNSVGEDVDSAPAQIVKGHAVSPSNSNRHDIICFPIIDWDFRFQRPQQMMSRWAAAGHRVFYIAQTTRETGTPYKIAKKGDNVYEVSLRGRELNVYQDSINQKDCETIFAALEALRCELNMGATAAFVQLPFWWPLAKRARSEFAWPIVYDCMDYHADFSTNRPEMVEQEHDLMEGADLVLVSSEFLMKEARPLNEKVLLLRNGCDFEHFAKSGERSRKPHGRRPVVGYYGAIADWFDSDLVADLAEKRPDWDFVLVGSTFTADLGRLAKLPNVTLPGEQPYSEIPDWLASFDVAILPFKRTPLTEATNPVKAYEILASGKPLVSVPLPEMANLRPLVRLASKVKDFEREINAALKESDTKLAEDRRAFARANTWDKRHEALAPLVRNLFPKASIIIVTFNNLDLNKLCLESLYERTEWPNFEVIVVDNGSADGTPEYLKEAERSFPNLRVVLNDDNSGFASANNIGLRLATGDYLVLLNNDTVLTRGWLTALIRHMHVDPEIGLIGPVTNQIGNEAKIVVGYDQLADLPQWAAEFVRENDSQSFAIPMLAMFCIAMTREVFEKVGCLDAQFEVGMFEDDDYTRRVKEAGYKIICARDSFVHHFGGASFKQLAEKTYLEIFVKNRRRYQQKWGEMWQPHLDQKDRGRIPGLLDQMKKILRESGVGANRVVIMLPSIGWNTPLVQRPHHIAQELAKQGYLVFFDCSGSVLDIFAGFISNQKNLWLYNGPSGVLGELEKPILWTLPYNSRLVDRWKNPTVVYDWIDDLSVFGYNQEKLRENHTRMLKEADIVLCVARKLMKEAKGTRSDIVYLPNAVDYHHFTSPKSSCQFDPRFSEMLSNGRPIAGYYGALASWFDVEMLARVAQQRPDWNFVIIGHVLSEELSLEPLKKHANVLVLEAQSYEVLPNYLAEFTVATIPFKINRITRATSPLKLYEYFAGGKPVISTPMPECQAFGEVHIVRNAREFSRALDVARKEAESPKDQEHFRMVARENSWTMRIQKVLKYLQNGSRKKDNEHQLLKPKNTDFARQSAMRKATLHGAES